MSESNGENRIEIRLDGSYGGGPIAELTIITRTEGGGQREESFQVPFFMIDTKRLQAFNDANLILGYKLVKGEKTPPRPERAWPMSLDLLTNTARPVEKKLKVVGCDLDDVLANFMSAFIDMAYARYGIPQNKSIRPVDWAWSNMGWTKDQESSLWQQLHDTPFFWEGLKVQPGVDPGLVQELAERTKMYFPTARAQSIGADVSIQSARWLQAKFGIPYPTVVVSNEKGPLAAALKYDYFIDDRDKNCLEVKMARPECQVFVSTSCHNLQFDNEAAGIGRVSGFNEFALKILSEE